MLRAVTRASWFGQVRRLRMRLSSQEASPKGKKPAGEDSNKNEDAWHIKLVDTFRQVQLAKITFPPEVMKEHARIGREYNKQTTLLHNKIQKDLIMKARLRDEAIAALPEDKRAHALTPDYTPFPPNRPFPAHSPPIRDFDPEQYILESDA